MKKEYLNLLFFDSIVTPVPKPDRSSGRFLPQNLVNFTLLFISALFYHYIT
jgi:hypothetical protein